jgi:hypothetical protein
MRSFPAQVDCTSRRSVELRLLLAFTTHPSSANGTTRHGISDFALLSEQTQKVCVVTLQCHHTTHQHQHQHQRKRKHEHKRKRKRKL